MKTIIIETTTLLRGSTGIGRWIDLLLKELPKNGWNVITVDRSKFGIDPGLGEYFYYNFLLPVWLKIKFRNDAVFLIPDNVSKFLFTPWKNTIYFVHDLIQLSGPESYTGFRRAIYKFKLKQLRNAKLILTTSRFVMDELKSLNWLLGKNIVPVGGFVDDIFLSSEQGVAPKSELPPKYILAVGTGEPRKNINALLDAYAQDTMEELPSLVLYGGNWQGKGWELIEKAACDRGISHRIIHVGRVSDLELIWLYEHAQAFVYLSNAEGFGLPPIEAMARNTLVVVNDLPVFHEVLGSNAFYCDASNVNELISVLIDVISFVRCESDCKSMVKNNYSMTAAISRALLLM